MRVTAGFKKREKLRKEFWPNADIWTLTNEVGWFRAPRTLPLILRALSSHQVSGKTDPSSTYLELLARHIDNGLVEMVSEADHAFAAGYEGSRGVRSWQERMKILEDTGFIKTQKISNSRYRYALIVHPTVVMHNLYKAGKISSDLWDAYRARKIEVKDLSFEEREESKKDNDVPEEFLA